MEQQDCRLVVESWEMEKFKSQIHVHLRNYIFLAPMSKLFQSPCRITSLTLENCDFTEPVQTLVPADIHASPTPTQDQCPIETIVIRGGNTLTSCFPPSVKCLQIQDILTPIHPIVFRHVQHRLEIRNCTLEAPISPFVRAQELVLERCPGVVSLHSLLHVRKLYLQDIEYQGMGVDVEYLHLTNCVESWNTQAVPIPTLTRSAVGSDTPTQRYTPPTRIRSLYIRSPRRDNQVSLDGRKYPCLQILSLADTHLSSIVDCPHLRWIVLHPGSTIQAQVAYTLPSSVFLCKEKDMVLPDTFHHDIVSGLSWPTEMCFQ